MKPSSSILNIPSYINFSATLAKFLYEQYNGDPTLQLFLPNYESSQTFYKAWKTYSPIRPYVHLLGNLQTLYIQESVAFQHFPPANVSYRNIFFCAYLTNHEGLQPSAALHTSYQIGDFLDTLYYEDKKPEIINFESLFSKHKDFNAKHTTLITSTLPRMIKEWKQHLLSIKKSDPTWFDTTCMRLLAKKWKKTPPSSPVVIAGSLGNRINTLELIQAITTFGYYIMPGLDQSLEDDIFSYIAENPTHPQYALARVLRYLKIGRENVYDLVNNEDSLYKKREYFIQKAFYPKKFLSRILDSPINLADIPQHWHTLTQANEQAEAESIAVIAKNALMNNNSVLIVSPSGYLQEFITHHLNQLFVNTQVLTSIPLLNTTLTSFILTLIELIFHSSLSLHNTLIASSHFTMPKELTNLISPFTKDRFMHLLIEGYSPFNSHDQQPPLINTYFSFFKKHLSQYLSPISSSPIHFTLKNIILILEHALPLFASNYQDDPYASWIEENFKILKQYPSIVLSKKNAVKFFHEWFLNIKIYPTILPSQQTLPIQIVNPLNARLLKADCVILASINDGLWPKDEDYNLWISKSMAEDLDITYKTMQQGLAAHDFIELLFAKQVWFTRSTYSGQGQQKKLTLMSRWLRRLDMVLHHNQSSLEKLQTHWPNALVETRYKSHSPKLSIQSANPKPKPLAKSLPKILYVTSLEQFKKNPYAFFLNHILKFRPYKFFHPLQNQAALFIGIFTHDILDKYANHSFPKEQNSKQKYAFMDKRLQAALPDVSLMHHDVFLYIKHKIQYILYTYVQWDTQDPLSESPKNNNWIAKKHTTEIVGKYKEHDLTIAAKADRIDSTFQGNILLDYKTGKPPSMKDIESYHYIQLPIEAALILKGAFPKISRDLLEMGVLQLTASKVSYYPFSLSHDECLRILNHALEQFQHIQSSWQGYPFVDTYRYDHYKHFSRTL